MPLKKGQFNSGIKNLISFPEGSSGYHFRERECVCACGMIFRSNGPNPKYCSSKCLDKYGREKQKKEWTCFFCEKKFLRRNPSNRGKFCSRQCSGMHRIANGKFNYFYKAFLNFEWKCSLCPVADYELLVVHHLDFNHSNNHLSNLQILCANCHYRIHFGRGRERKIKLKAIKAFLERKNNAPTKG